MKILSWIRENVLFVSTLLLFAFIPLYPKLPLIDVKNTWVYVRVEDFLIIVVIILWLVLLIRRKITFRTPLTMPILIFWIVGAIATIHGVILIFPTLAGVFPNVALLSYLRRVEYLSLFFIAYAGMRDKRFLSATIIVLVVTLLLVVGYGFGQKYFGFPAFLTMNEEFAKGEPIRLSALSRVPSTFAGHYDLAAYLVLIIPILASLIFGFRNWFMRSLLLVSVILGFILLFMTVSRVSFVVLLLSLVLVLFFQRKKLAILSIVLLTFLAPIFIVQFTPALLARFGNTVKEVEVLVDASTGEVIGQTSFVPSSHFTDKLILRRVFQEAAGVIPQANLKENELLNAAPSAFLKHKFIPQTAVLIIPQNSPTGENLPQGTAYINLSLSPVTKRVAQFFYENPSKKEASSSAISYVFFGNFLIKKAAAYDLSFTTRFQGEWPNTLIAFKRNILFGSGYGSVSLAVDNNYLRILGETGFLGFLSFMAIFISIAIYVRKIYPDVDSRVARSFVLGFVAGVVGLMLNGFLIDVFEASKVAFVLWLLSGVTLGILSLYQQKQINLLKELRQVMTSAYMIIVYLFVLVMVIFVPMINNYFVADDYTWLRWAADCGLVPGSRGGMCPSPLSTILHYFTDAGGFFYRPGTKIFFFMMYPVFWLNQTVYHIVSLFLHFIVASLFFLLALKILRDKFLAALTAVLFLFMSGYVEIVFWISATGHLFNAVFILLSLLFFILWDEKKRTLYFIVSIISLTASLLFYELGVVVPLLVILYKMTRDDSFSLRRIVKVPQYLVMFVPVILYIGVRYIAQSHWSGGDYSYNLIKLPFNALGNMIGYIFLTYLGPISLPLYQTLRDATKTHLFLSVVLMIPLLLAGYFLYKFIQKKVDREDKRVLLFGSLFSVIALLPFLGFGNIAPRYSYVASFGLTLVLVFLLKKIYLFLLSSGKPIAFASITTIVSIFCLIHIIQVQQIHSDWYEAGEKARRFFISIDAQYQDYWSKKDMQFYLINIPVRVGQAWVFPVGIPDALWFVFQNPRIQVSGFESRKAAIETAGPLTKTKKVFEFNSTGEVTERFSVSDDQ